MKRQEKLDQYIVKDAQTEFLEEYVRVWLDIQRDFRESDIGVQSSHCFHVFDGLAYGRVRHPLLQRMQVGRRVGARQYDVKAAVSSQTELPDLHVP